MTPHESHQRTWLIRALVEGPSRARHVGAMAERHRQGQRGRRRVGMLTFQRRARHIASHTTSRAQQATRRPAARERQHLERLAFALRRPYYFRGQRSPPSLAASRQLIGNPASLLCIGDALKRIDRADLWAECIGCNSAAAGEKGGGCRPTIRTALSLGCGLSVGVAPNVSAVGVDEAADAVVSTARWRSRETWGGCHWTCMSAPLQLRRESLRVRARTGDSRWPKQWLFSFHSTPARSPSRAPDVPRLRDTISGEGVAVRFGCARSLFSAAALQCRPT